MKPEQLRRTTPADVKGPFYKAGASLRANFVEAGSTAERMLLTGVVRSARLPRRSG